MRGAGVSDPSDQNAGQAPTAGALDRPARRLARSEHPAYYHGGSQVPDPKPPRGSWIIGIAGFLVAATGLLVLLGIVWIAVAALPEGNQKAQNVVAISSTAFGVIGAIVGAYFGVRTAGNAVERVVQSQAGGGDGGGAAGARGLPPSAAS